jgi:predicted transcriptional regulator
MKAVLISIQPKWCELIASGKKTVEVRKTRPKLITPDEPFKVYIYCTQDKYGWFHFGKKERLDGKVIGEFVCDYISVFRPKSLTCESAIKKASCLTVQGLIDDAGKNNHLFGWHISELKIYDEPKPLSEFYAWKKCNSCKTSGYESSACIYDEDCKVPAVVTRPPQSWCYVQEDE